ncbi:MAG: hypothetical protein HY927_07760 [Elusimicrobia bacterium]|nr:hypothetical protein [Elusimicrobiota bacterium]
MAREHPPRTGGSSPAGPRPASWAVPLGIALGVFLFNISFAAFGFMSPDASLYLDIGRNILSGKGAVTSSNFYHFWLAKHHPALPYVPPLYPVFAGVVWKLAGLKGAIGANILLLGANCGLLYAILSRTSGRLAAALAALLVGVTFPVVKTSIYPWTEQLHLLFLLSAFHLHLAGRRKDVLVGVILGASCLVRVASLHNIAAFALSRVVLEGLSREALLRQAKTALGVLAVLLPYEAFCWLAYGIVFPEYPAASKTFTLAGYHPGAYYALAMPVLRAPPIPLETGTIAMRFLAHLGSFITAFDTAVFALVLAPLLLILNRERRRDPVLVTLLAQGFVPILLFSISFTWRPDVDGPRYLLIPLVAIMSSTLVLTRDLAAGFLEGLEKRWRLATALSAVPFFALALPETWESRRNPLLLRPDLTADHVRDRDVVYRWIRENTPEDSLVVSDQIMDSFLFDRPFVCFPFGAAYTPTNVEGFLSVYKPDYALTNNPQLYPFLLKRGYASVMETRSLAVLRRKP